MLTLKPRSLSSRPSAAAVTPLPTELTTPPVRKMYFGPPLIAPPPAAANTARKGRWGGRPQETSPPFRSRLPFASRRSSDDLPDILGGAPHLEQDQAEAGLLSRQDRQHGLGAGAGQEHVSAAPMDVDLVQSAAAEFPGDALAQAQHRRRHGRNPVFLHAAGKGRGD